MNFKQNLFSFCLFFSSFGRHYDFPCISCNEWIRRDWISFSVFFSHLFWFSLVVCAVIVRLWDYWFNLVVGKMRNKRIVTKTKPDKRNGFPFCLFLLNSFGKNFGEEFSINSSMLNIIVGYIAFCPYDQWVLWEL